MSDWMSEKLGIVIKCWVSCGVGCYNRYPEHKPAEGSYAGSPRYSCLRCGQWLNLSDLPRI